MAKVYKFDLSKDLNHKDNYYKTWETFKKKYPRHKNERSMDLRKIMHNFWKFIADEILENEHGIFLDHVGYFCVSMIKIGNVGYSYKTAETYLNYATDGKVPRIMIYTDAVGGNPMSGWRFNPSRYLEKQVMQRVKNGKKYQNNYDLVHRNRKALKWEAIRK